MSAVERLAAALPDDVIYRVALAEGPQPEVRTSIAKDMTWKDPNLAADIELGAAWRRAEAALPEGWKLKGVRRHEFVDEETSWSALAEITAGLQPFDVGTGPTPTAALNALAEKLE